MKKISTLFKKDPNNLSLVINEVDPENAWIYTSGIPTRKYDGTACLIKNRVLYKRFDAKPGRMIPINAIPCCPPDPITGHWPHWVNCEKDNPADKYHFEAFYNNVDWMEGTYELCGPKINGNPERLNSHVLFFHGKDVLALEDFSFDNIRTFLSNVDIEGIVFWDQAPTGKMCKIRKSDFGIKR